MFAPIYLCAKCGDVWRVHEVEEALSIPTYYASLCGCDTI